MTRVKDALVVAKEAKSKAKAEVAPLEGEWTSLLMEVRVTKDEVSSLQSQAGKDKAALEEDYQTAMELIFAYGYECCMFKHNICGDQPEVPDGMPDSSNPYPLKCFANPRCPSVLAATDATTSGLDQSEATKEP